MDEIPIFTARAILKSSNFSRAYIENNGTESIVSICKTFNEWMQSCECYDILFLRYGNKIIAIDDYAE